MQNQVSYDEVFDAQEHYRLLLDSLSRPGKINTIPFLDIGHLESINNASALIALALLNNDVSFCAAGNETAARFIALHSAAKTADVHLADFLFISGLHNADILTALKTGSLSYPEDSATIIADVLQLSYTAIPNALQLTLKGPGIQQSTVIYVAGLNPRLLDELKIINLEFPLGIDLFLTDQDNRVVGIPRSSQVTYLPAGNHLFNN